MADGSASSSAGWWLLLLLVACWWLLTACGSPMARLFAGLVELLGAALAAAWCCGVWPWQRTRCACPVLELPTRGRRHWHCSRRGAALCRWAAARRGAQSPQPSRPRAWRCRRLRARPRLLHAICLLLVVALLLAELRTTDLAVWSEVHRLESPLWGEQQTMASLGLLLTSLCGGAPTSMHSGAWALCIAMCSGTCVLCLLLAFAAVVRRTAASPGLLLLFLLAECGSEAREGSLPALQAWGALAFGCAALWMHRLVSTRGWGLWCRAVWDRSVQSRTASRSHPTDAEIVGGHGCANCCVPVPAERVEQASDDGHDGDASECSECSDSEQLQPTAPLEPLLREATAQEQAMFLETQARAAVQQEEEAEELLLDLPPQGSTAQCPRAPRQLCVDCDPPKAVAQTRCEECNKGLCGDCTTTCLEGCEWHGTTLCARCNIWHQDHCVPVPAERVGQDSDKDGPPPLVECSSDSEDERGRVRRRRAVSSCSDSSDSDEEQPSNQATQHARNPTNKRHPNNPRTHQPTTQQTSNPTRQQTNKRQPNR